VRVSPPGGRLGRVARPRPRGRGREVRR